MKVWFLIRSLGYGGAERQLVLLSQALQARGHDVAVAVCYSGGPLEEELRQAGIRIVALQKRGRWDLLAFLRRLVRLIRVERPDVLHGYLSEPNLFTLVVKLLCPSVRIVWGVRGSILDFSRYEWVDRVSFHLNRWLARFADAVIVNSQAGLSFHLEQGYPFATTVCVPNGVDTERFRPDAGARQAMRERWGVGVQEKLVGLVGRLDPMKDHPVFLEAASLLAARRAGLRFVCVGIGDRAYRESLEARAGQGGLAGQVLWPGSVDDMPAVYNALDCHVSASYGEGLPNVVAEAMACGVPCVVTDVGDSAWVVGDCGEVVPPKHPKALADAIDRLLTHDRCSAEERRARILDRLSVTAMTLKTERVLEGLLQRRRLSPVATRVA